MQKQLDDFLARTLPLASYSPDQPLFVVTDNDQFFENIRSTVERMCKEYHQTKVTDEDMEEHEYEVIRVIRIAGNDIFTPRSYSAIGCIVQDGIKVTDGCLKAVTNTMLARFKDPRKAFLELDVSYGQS